MSTATTVHTLLTTGEARLEAAELAAALEVHTLIARLKDLYTRTYGAVALDVHDWHWQAVALKNHVMNQKEAAHESVSTPVPGANSLRGTAPAGARAAAPLKPVTPAAGTT